MSLSRLDLDPTKEIGRATNCPTKPSSPNSHSKNHNPMSNQSIAYQRKGRYEYGEFDKKLLSIQSHTSLWC
ncbi:protein of unknown function [Legionella fallonii LLAP-10]|uniref:Uncharacterized protein n=1 Tax=Legionella fallonii LLAP-10 TaxID=1212491 RepID=A0A098G3B9_9GAMM|nr:protein of unknown function [Legionella fallonii LLAP-10]